VADPAVDLVLASGSPRRGALLELLQVPFEVVPADIDESPLRGESPRDHVMRVVAAKAAVVRRQRPHAVVLAADTTVDLDGHILGKPVDADEAKAMLRALSGREHLVHTAVECAGEQRLVSTVVVFDVLGSGEIARYVRSGEPLDKAGAYAIQGAGAAFVLEVRGSVTNVVGLPLAETRRLLRAAGVSC
jgi:septum formation protein